MFSLSRKKSYSSSDINSFLCSVNTKRKNFILDVYDEKDTDAPEEIVINRSGTTAQSKPDDKIQTFKLPDGSVVVVDTEKTELTSKSILD
jgi:hypothetical protein